MVNKDKEFNFNLLGGLIGGMFVYWSQIFYEAIITLKWNIFLNKALSSLLIALILFCIFIFFQMIFRRVKKI